MAATSKRIDILLNTGESVRGKAIIDNENVLITYNKKEYSSAEEFLNEVDYDKIIVFEPLLVQALTNAGYNIKSDYRRISVILSDDSEIRLYVDFNSPNIKILYKGREYNSAKDFEEVLDYDSFVVYDPEETSLLDAAGFRTTNDLRRVDVELEEGGKTRGYISASPTGVSIKLKGVICHTPEELSEIVNYTTLIITEPSLADALRKAGFVVRAKGRKRTSLHVTIPQELFDCVMREAEEKNSNPTAIVENILINYYK